MKTTLETGVVVKESLSYDFGYKHTFKVKNPYLKKYPMCEGTVLDYLVNTIKISL
jgi:hypothetical protein